MVDDKTLEAVVTYKYLGQVVNKSDNDRPEINTNLSKVKNYWG